MVLVHVPEKLHSLREAKIGGIRFTFTLSIVILVIGPLLEEYC
jgi:hypothetical protein